MGKMMRAIGLMSGTSMDGIDVALIETDGEDAVAARPVRTRVPTTPRSAAALRAGDRRGRALSDRDDAARLPGEVERELTERHAAAVEQLPAAARAAAPATSTSSASTARPCCMRRSGG